MRFKIIYLFIFPTLFLSCTKNKQEHTTNYLTGGSEKFWTAVMDYPIKRYMGVSYNINGTYGEYIISDSGLRTERILYSLPVWKLINETTLIDGNADTLKIEYINDDVLVLNKMSSRGKKKIFVYLKSTDQHTKPVKDTTKSKNRLDM